MGLENDSKKSLNLTFYQLLFIPSLSAGLPAIVTGNTLNHFGPESSIIGSIIVGNLILWVVGTAIISMAYESRTNAIENAKVYIGKRGAYLISFILAFSLINWFGFLISGSVKTILHHSHFNLDSTSDFSVRLGAFLGFICALLSIGKLKLIKWISVFGFPIILAYHLYILLNAELLTEGWGISFSGIISTMLVFLPGVMNLPTIFRHSRSRPDTFLGFALMIIVIIIFQISSMLSPVTSLLNPEKGYLFNIFSLLFLVVYPLISNNLINIYYASACWETFLPHSMGIKGNVIFGLLGTAFYTFIQIPFPIQFMRDLINCYLSNFGIVLLVSFLIETIIKHRPRTIGKFLNMTGWIVGCIVATIWQIRFTENEIQPLFAGIGAIALFFLTVIFIEEIFWSIKMLAEKKNYPQS